MAYQKTYNLLVVDDHQLIIDGLTGILKDEPLISEIYSATDGEKAIELANQLPIDCILMDINMPKVNGHDATRTIKKQNPSIKVIIVSMISDASVIIKLLKAGADAFIVKNTGKEELLKAIEKVMNNEKYVSHELNINLYEHLGRQRSGAVGSQLTPREKEIIKYISKGFTNPEIAERLFISGNTVDTHRKNILAKLALKNTAALVRYAAENDLL